MGSFPEIVICCLFAYLCGSIPFGYLAGKIKGIDVRQTGSKNIGATNSGRILGRFWFFLILALDFLKAYLPLLVINSWQHSQEILALAGLCAVLGHIYPIWFADLKGGKGIATATGVFAVVMPWGLFVAFIIFIMALASTKYMSASTLLATLVIFFYRLGDIVARQEDFFALSSLSLTLLVVLTTFFIFYKHRHNIKRLWRGEESKFGI